MVIEYVIDSCITMSFSLLKRVGRHGIVLLAIFSWIISGCGKDDAIPLHYNPSSPLPLRVDVIATPIPFPTPDDSQENPITPTPTAIPAEVNKLEELTPSSNPTEPPKPREPSPTAAPTTAPTVTPAPSPKIDQTQTKLSEPPMPLRVVDSPKETDLMEPGNVPISTEEQNESSAVNAEPERKDVATSVNAESEQEDITTSEESLEDVSSESEGPVPENDPIVTPYDITIDQLRVCSKLTDRSPSGCTDTFSLAKTGEVFIWMKVSDVKPPQVIKHVYYWEKKKVATVSLKLKYSSMRTWSQKTFKPDQTGTWKVVITTEDDDVVATRTWIVTP